MTINSKLEKQGQRTVDQRHIPLPAVWVVNDSAKLISNLTPQQNAHENLVLASNFTNAVVELLDQAQHTAIICSFILASEPVSKAIESAADRGVRVYLMLASETHLKRDNPIDDFSKKCREDHIALLKKLAGKVGMRSAEHYHSKAVLIDAIGPGTDNAKGILLTANLTKEALERNEELAIYLSNAEIEYMANLLKWAFFEYAEHEIFTNSGNFEPVKPFGTIPHPKNDNSILCTTGNSQTIREATLDLIHSAQKQLIISSYGWQEDHEIIEAICDQAKKGIEVIIFSRVREKSMNALTKIKKAGARVFGFKWLHAKAIWNDQGNGMIMSANLEKNGLDAGFETGIRFHGNRANALKNALTGFLDKSHHKLVLDSRLGDHLGSVKLWQANQFTEFEIAESENLDWDKPVIADCASNLEKEPDIAEQNWIDHPAHEIIFNYVVSAPSLPRNAKQKFQTDAQSVHPDKNATKKKAKQKSNQRNQPFDPPAYRGPDGILIAITDPAELQKAIALKEARFKDAHIVIKD